MIPNYYPYLIFKKDFYNFEVYLFSKNNLKLNIKEAIIFSNTNNFEQNNEFWSNADSISDTISYSGIHSCFISNKTEFSPTFSIKYNSVLNNKSEVIQTSVKYYSSDNICNAYLVLSMENSKEAVQWNYVNLNDFIDKDKKWQTANLIIQIGNIHFTSNKKFKIYIWNLNKDEFFIDDFSVKVHKGNRNRFNY